MRHPRLIAFFLLLSTLEMVPNRAFACEFFAVAFGECPVSTAEDRVAREYDGDRAAAVRDLAWINFSEFRDLDLSQKIILNVCVFQRPARFAFDKIETVSRDFRNNLSLYRSVVGQIRNAVKPWEDAEIEGFVSSRSRIDFVFTNSNGTQRNCEDESDNHILVMIATHNSSAVGFEQLEAATTGFPKKRATMVLNLLGNGKVTPDKVLHEFGHAMGFLHEMHHDDWSDCAAAFNADAFARSVSFGRDKTHEEKVRIVELNVRSLPRRYRRAARSQTFSFEREGIMSYQISEEFFDPTKVDPKKCAMPEDAVRLTQTDIALFLGVYGH